MRVGEVLILRTPTCTSNAVFGGSSSALRIINGFWSVEIAKIALKKRVGITRLKCKALDTCAGREQALRSPRVAKMHVKICQGIAKAISFHTDKNRYYT